MDYQALRVLIDSEPLNAEKTDDEVTVWVNEPADGENPSVSSAEVTTIILGNRQEWEAIEETDKAFIMDVLTISGETLLIPESGGGARQELINIFGDGQLRTDFRKLIKKITTRGGVAGITGKIRHGDVTTARELETV